METSDKETNLTNQRHGCVTTWLMLILVINSLTALFYLLIAGEIVEWRFEDEISKSLIFLIVIMLILNVVFSIMLLKWRKWGFWGLTFTCTCSIIINVVIGIGLFQSIAGIVGLVLLFGILQIKKNKTSTWSNLK